MRILQGRTLEWVAMPSFSIAGGFFTFGATREAQEYWSGKPIPSPGDLPNPGIELGSPALQTDSLPGNYDLRFYSDFEFPRDFTHIMISFAPSSGLPW